MQRLSTTAPAQWFNSNPKAKFALKFALIYSAILLVTELGKQLPTWWQWAIGLAGAAGFIVLGLSLTAKRLRNPDWREQSDDSALDGMGYFLAGAILLIINFI